KQLKDFVARATLKWTKYFSENQPVTGDATALVRTVSEFLFANPAMHHPLIVQFFQSLQGASRDAQFMKLVCALGMLNMSAIFSMLLLRRRAGRRGNEPRTRPRKLFRQIIIAVAGKPIRKPTGMTAREFVRTLAVGREHGSTNALGELLDIYYA